jgi:hypothetical protein
MSEASIARALDVIPEHCHRLFSSPRAYRRRRHDGPNRDLRGAAQAPCEVEYDFAFAQLVADAGNFEKNFLTPSIPGFILPSVVTCSH